jgi:hypothetical protein
MQTSFHTKNLFIYHLDEQVQEQKGKKKEPLYQDSQLGFSFSYNSYEDDWKLL